MLSSDDSDGGSPPRVSTTPTHHQRPSPARPPMPAQFTNVVGLVQSSEPNQWRVCVGDDLPKFIFANGPARITAYNFSTSQEMNYPKRVTRIKSTAKNDLSDVFQLTTAGHAASGSLLGWRVELACTGKSLYEKASPNCRRACCGGFGICLSDEYRRTHHPHHAHWTRPRKEPWTQRRGGQRRETAMMTTCVSHPVAVPGTLFLLAQVYTEQV